jgi:thymidine kinase
MKNEDNIIKMLRSNNKFNPNSPYVYGKIYEEIKEQEMISDKVLQEILELSNNRLDNRLFQGDFLEKFEYFTPSQLQMIEQFIHQHINNKDCLFVSSLIDCANFNHILSFHGICIEFIKRKRNNLVVLSALDYLFEHMNFHDIGRIVTTFNRVLNNKKYYQNCQTKASFYLFRITHHQKYYDFLKSLILDGDEINYLVLKNSLQGMDYNKKKYFAYSEDLMTIIKSKGKHLAANNAAKTKKEE